MWGQAPWGGGRHFVIGSMGGGGRHFVTGSLLGWAGLRGKGAESALQPLSQQQWGDFSEVFQRGEKQWVCRCFQKFRDWPDPIWDHRQLLTNQQSDRSKLCQRRRRFLIICVFCRIKNELVEWETALCSFIRLRTYSRGFIVNGVNPSIGGKNQMVAPLNWLLASTQLLQETN